MVKFIGALFLSLPFLNLPTPSGWVFFAALLGIAFWLYRRSEEYRILWERKNWASFSALILLTLLSNFFIGIYIKPPGLMSWPNMPIENPGAVWMLFGSLGWMIAGGMLGPLAAFSLGLLTGLLRAPFAAHTLFTALEFGLVAMLFSIAVRQRYRTFLYKILRQPIFAALALLPISSILFLLGVFFSGAYSEATARLDFAINNMVVTSIAMFGELLFAGLVVQVIAFFFPERWGRNQALKPSPAERRLETRFFIGTGTFIIILLFSLLIGDWIIAGQAARRMLRERLESTAQVAAESVPFFLETGQNLGAQLANDPALLSDSRDDLAQLLAKKIRLVPYFNQLFVVNPAGEILGEYPPSDEAARYLAQEEINGIALAFSGIPSQIYTVPPLSEGEPARVSFLMKIPDADGNPSRVLVGRTNLSTNPITTPLLKNLDNMSAIDGQGFLIDENRNILYHSNNDLIMDIYDGEYGKESVFYDGISSSGTRELVFFQPVVGRSWAVVLKVPAREVQALSLQIAVPLSILLLVLTALALIALRFSMRGIIQSLEGLASEAGLIAQGDLDHALKPMRTDEIGQLRRAFEQMRLSLKDRLDDLNRLLVVSRSIASSLKMKDIFQPVLEAIASTGAEAVQVVLSPEIIPNSITDMPTRFAIEKKKGKYAHLDAEIFEALQNEERLVLPNIARTSGGLQLSEHRENPAALLALPLRNEDQRYGVLWAAYETPKLFTEADIRFITTLGGQAALAAANASLFLDVEVSRQQLAAILDSTSDPVLVTDHKDRLLLANPATWKVLQIEEAHALTPIAEILKRHPDLINLMQLSAPTQEPVELDLAEGKTYLATASSVIAEEQPIGRVCILRDVTHFKELDTLKSEFVSTVSHDLRSPLTLMRGYATMMEMAGDLNDQQKGYIKKIITGVENMSRLVNNLLDLGRIELGVGLKVEKVPVIDILDRVYSALQLRASEKDIHFSLETAPDLPPLIEADQDLLHQAIYNLVENAIKYTPKGKAVNLHAHASSESIFFEIQDSGIGISKDDQAHLFEKFFRSSMREARTQQGTGLGLAIVRSIAENHGGRVWVESQPGQGSAFHLQVPLTQPKPGVN